MEQVVSEKELCVTDGGTFYMITPEEIKSLNLVPDANVSDHEWVRRSWKERLFSRPWEPFQAWRSVPCTTLYFLEGYWICSYKTYARFRDDVR